MPIGEAGLAIALKALGALAGALVAMAFLPPRSRREGIQRAIASPICGVLFAPQVRDYLGWGPTAENLVAAGALAAMAAWPALGVGYRVVRAWKGPGEAG